jgi:hypothetical protein
MDRVRKHSSRTRPYGDGRQKYVQNRIHDKQPCLFEKASKLILIGQSGVGKSMFLYNLLREGFFEEPIASVFICSPSKQSDLVEMCEEYLKENNSKTVLIHQTGVPDPETYLSYFKNKSLTGYHLWFLDDLYCEAASSPDIARLFTVHSRHDKITVCLTAHSFKERMATHFKLMKFNASHLVLFANAIGLNEVFELGKSILASDARLLTTIYNYATSGRRHGYLIVDLTPGKRLCERFFTDIFRHERTSKKMNCANFYEIPSLCMCDCCSEPQPGINRDDANDGDGSKR